MLTELDNSLSTGYAIPIANLVSFDSDEASINSNADDSSVLDTSLPDEVDAFPIVVSKEEEALQTLDPDQPLKEQNTSRLTPLSILTADTIGSVWSQKLLKVLFDPGSTYTFIHRRALPRHCQPFKIKSARKINTLNGNNTCNEMVILQDIRLPEFDKS